MSTQAPPLNPAALLEQAREQGRVLLTGVPKVRGRLELDLSRDPPPDLAVEVEVSPTFAGLPLAEAIDFLQQALKDHLSVVRAFRGWVRQQR
jgi:hypothetical protein